MEATGLLERRRDQHDARLVRLWLTPHGRDVRSAIEAERDALAERMLAPLTARERETLISALQKIINEIDRPTSSR
jgi:DNA-binding MarR family transcriptional regulator